MFKNDKLHKKAMRRGRKAFKREGINLGGR
jgi:hypothetical protein